MRKFNIWNSYTRYFLWFFVASLLGTLLTGLVGGALYALLHDIAPLTFPKYSPIFNREEYEAQNALFSAVGALLSVTLITYITMRNDNTRYERMISKTDGMYRLPRGAKIYFKMFLLHDILSSLIIPLLHFLLLLIPIDKSGITLMYATAENMSELVLLLTYTPRMVSAYFGFKNGIIITLALSLISRFICLFPCLEAYRSHWLSDID